MTSPPAPASIRLATASPATQPTTSATLAQLRQIARRAADAHKVDILLLPEAYIGGYPRGSAFGATVGGRSAEGRDEFLRYFEAAVDLGDVVGDGCAGGGEAWVSRRLGSDAALAATGVDGGSSDEGRRGDGTREELEAIAAETGVFLVTGCIERVGGSLYCAAVYVCPNKGIIGKRRKVMPVRLTLSSFSHDNIPSLTFFFLFFLFSSQTGTERLIWAQASPRSLQAVSTVIRGVRINMAAAICWENYMPLLRQSLYAQNVNLYLMPTADGRDSWLALARTVGIEGRCFVVSSNMCVRGASSSSSPGSSAVADAGVDRGDVSPYQQEQPRARRNSAITEEGFEIALPTHSAANGTKQQQRRRKSVIDEDGNEIVLPCGEQTPGTTTANKNISANGTNGQVKSSKAGAAEEFISRGGSCITGPFGDVLAGPQWEDDHGIIYADVDFKDCIRGRLDYDAGGSYSR